MAQRLPLCTAFTVQWYLNVPSSHIGVPNGVILRARLHPLLVHIESSKVILNLSMCRLLPPQCPTSRSTADLQEKARCRDAYRNDLVTHATNSMGCRYKQR